MKRSHVLTVFNQLLFSTVSLTAWSRFFRSTLKQLSKNKALSKHVHVLVAFPEATLSLLHFICSFIILCLDSFTWI